jgi:hypothetical protein
MTISVTDRRACKDEPAGGTAVNLGELPVWKLSDLYDGPGSAAITADFAEADRRIAAFEM